MLFDLSNPSGGRPAPGHDVCIAGAGPAGIVLALSLAEKGLRVLLLEGGGLDDAGEASDSYQLEQPDSAIRYAAEASRRRYFGGTTAHWGGWSVPFSEIDFEARGPLPGWPIGFSDLAKHYPRASEFCEINIDTFEPSTLGNEHTIFEHEGQGFRNQWFGFSPPTRFGQRYRDEIVGSESIDLLIHANVVGIEHSDGVVKALEVRSLDGQAFRASAAQHVLAMGGIECTRLLLAASKDQPILGNRGDWLGYGFMDHYGYRPGWLLSDARLSYFRVETPAGPTMPVLTPDPDLLREFDLNNFCIMSTPVRPDDTLGRHYGDSRVLGLPGEQIARHRLQMVCEPTPTRASRISLSNEQDALGLPRVQLAWHIDDWDIAYINRASDQLARWVGAMGIGRMQRSAPLDDEGRRSRNATFHHMGTTRMSDSAETGVVDGHCRVFDTENLFVASSSVFPRGGFANPTISIVALSLRLAEHLASQQHQEQTSHAA